MLCLRVLGFGAFKVWAVRVKRLGFRAIRVSGLGLSAFRVQGF